MNGKELLVKDRTIFLMAISNALHVKNVYAISVYMYLIDQAETFEPSQNRIADALGISRNSVIKALQLLVEHGLLRKVFDGNRHMVSRYEFMLPTKRVSSG